MTWCEAKQDALRVGLQRNARLNAANPSWPRQRAGGEDFRYGCSKADDGPRELKPPALGGKAEFTEQRANRFAQAGEAQRRVAPHHVVPET